MVRAIKRDANGNIETDSYLSAMDKVPEVYAIIFGSGFAEKILRGDVQNSAGLTRKFMNELPDGAGKTLHAMVAHGMKTVPREVAVKDKDSICRQVLWLNRAVRFITRFLEGLAEGRTSSDAASHAYATEIKMYHGWLVGKAVGSIMSIAPNKESIIRRFGFPTEEAILLEVNTLIKELRPLVDEVLKLLDDLGSNFAEKV